MKIITCFNKGQSEIVDSPLRCIHLNSPRRLLTSAMNCDNKHYFTE